MSVLTLFRQAIVKSKQALQVIDFSLGKRLKYLFLLAFIFSLPLYRLAYQELDVLRDNGQSIMQKVPDFHVEKGQLQTTEDEAFMVKTNYLIFTFNPNKQLEDADIRSESGNQPIAIELGEEALSVKLFDQPLSLPYTELSSDRQNFDQKAFKKLLQQFVSPQWSFLFITAGLIFLWSSLHLFILTCVIGLILTFFRFSKEAHLTYGQCLSLGVMGLTRPVTFFSVLLLFGFAIPFQTELLVIFALFIIWQLTRFTKILKLNEDNIDEIFKQMTHRYHYRRDDEEKEHKHKQDTDHKDQ